MLGITKGDISASINDAINESHESKDLFVLLAHWRNRHFVRSVCIERSHSLIHIRWMKNLEKHE